MSNSSLTPNQLAFLGLSNEYCQAVELASETNREDFIDNMLRLLPRIYITASDLQVPVLLEETPYIHGSLEEEYYNAVRLSMEMLLEADDTYLEVFEEDMKYSDTPIAASVSESLADIFQVLYNLTNAVKDAPLPVIEESLAAVKDDFGSYWSRPLCNVLRALNAIKYKS